MAARKTPGPGSLPTRGTPASVVVAVRLTPGEAAKLDALGPSRGDTLRRLIEEAPAPALVCVSGPVDLAAYDLVIEGRST